MKPKPEVVEIARKYWNQDTTGNRFMRRDDSIYMAKEIMRLAYGEPKEIVNPPKGWTP